MTTGKDRQLIWGQEQHSAFDEIKNRLQMTPVLHLPDGKEDSTYTQILVSMLWVVLCTTFKMVN